MCIFGPNASSWWTLQSRGCVCCTAQSTSHIQPLFGGWCRVGKENTLGSVSMHVCSGGEGHAAMQEMAAAGQTVQLVLGCLHWDLLVSPCFILEKEAGTQLPLFGAREQLVPGVGPGRAFHLLHDDGLTGTMH